MSERIEHHVDRRTRGARGLTMLEAMVAVGLLSVICMGLIALITSSRTLTSMQRERGIASDAVQAYIEAMRAKTLAQLYSDTTTPADYLPAPNALRGARGIVVKCDNEQGVQAVGLAGGYGTVNASTNVIFTSAVTNVFDPFGNAEAGPSDTTALAFGPSGRDLNADGTTAGDLRSRPDQLVILPAMVKLEWVSSGSNGKGSLQKVVVYVCFGH